MDEIWDGLQRYIDRRFFVGEIELKGSATIKAFFDGVAGETFEYSRYIYKSNLNRIAKDVGYNIIKGRLQRYSNTRMVRAVSINDCDIKQEPVIFNSVNLDIPKEVEATS